MTGLAPRDLGRWPVEPRMAALFSAGALMVVVGLVPVLWASGVFGGLGGIPGSLVEPSGLQGLLLVPVYLLGGCCGGFGGLVLIATGLCTSGAAALTSLAGRGSHDEAR